METRSQLSAGIDIGSLSADAVIMDGARLLAHAILSTGANSEVAARKAYDQTLEALGISESDVSTVGATSCTVMPWE